MQRKSPRRGAFKEKGGPAIQLSAVVFVDFLGFAEKIRLADEKGEANKLLARLTEFVGNWRGALVDRYGLGGQRLWEVKIFTERRFRDSR